MSGQDDVTGGIASFSIGLGNAGTQARPVSPAPPIRVLMAGDFGLPAQAGALNVTGLDVAEILEANAPAFSVSAGNLLGSHPSDLEERLAFAALKDLRPARIASRFQFARDLETAAGDPDSLASHGQRYDKVLEMLRATRSPEQAPPVASSAAPSDRDAASADSAGTDKDGLDALFSMIETPGKTSRPSDSGSLAKAAVEAFVQQTMREERQGEAKPAPAVASPVTALQEAQARRFFDQGKLRTVLQNWHGLKLLLSEIRLGLPLEMHLLQLDHDLTGPDLADVLGGPDGALQADLYDVVLFANLTGLAAADADLVKTLARECEDADTVGLLGLEAGFSGVPGAELASLEAAHQLLDQPGYEGFKGLRDSDAASHLALFWNEARLVSEGPGHPAVFAQGAWIALAQILGQLGSEVFPRLPVGVPVDFDALEVAEGEAKGRAVATAARYVAGPGTAPSLAQCGINVLEGVANRTDLLFRRGVTVKPGKEGRGSLDQALLVSRLFSLFQEALGGAVTGAQTAQDRETAVRRNLDDLSTALAGQVVFEVARQSVEDQDLIGVSATVREGWATGQQHSFYLPASDS
ncbi:hypothetical protein [Roseibium sp.]|uniref:hypothetical protein n=1 Tax=Roseibium sp. TaxID=1936156 RepID=UPI003265BA30